MNNQKLLALVKKYGSPLYIYDAQTILDRYNELVNIYTWPKTKTLYAMKANYNFHILKLLKTAGATIDAVSPGDVDMALLAGYKSSAILFTANRITDAEMHYVKKLNVLFNIGEISRLEKFAKAYPNSEVCVRFNPMVIAGEHKHMQTGGENNKFGISLEHKQKVLSIAKKYKLKIVGIHEHTGSGIPETVQMMAGIKNILNIINKIDFPDLKFVDFGGGFKPPYKKNEKRINYKLFGKQVSEIFKNFCKKYGQELEMRFEPGKYVVAESGQLLVEVTDIKKTTDKIMAGVNAGFPQLIRPMFYGAHHEIHNISNPKAKPKTYDVIGNICESGDCFAVDRKIPLIREGDILAIKTAGAYCYSMGGNYNLRSMPTELLIYKNKVKAISRRLSSKQLVKSLTF